MSLQCLAQAVLKSGCCNASCFILFAQDRFGYLTFNFILLLYFLFVWFHMGFSAMIGVLDFSTLHACLCGHWQLQVHREEMKFLPLIQQIPTRLSLLFPSYFCLNNEMSNPRKVTIRAPPLSFCVGYIKQCHVLNKCLLSVF
jgi:hypothetical protein